MPTRLFFALAGISAFTLALFDLLSRADVPGAAAIAFVAALIFGAALAVWLSEPIRRASGFTRAMGTGTPKARLPETAGGTAGDLYRALNRLAEAHRQKVEELESEKAEADLILRGMGEGVLAVTPEGTVARANPEMRAVIAATDNIEGRAVSALFRNPQLVWFLSPDSVPDEGDEAEFDVFGRTMLVAARRLPAGGVVAVFSDLTTLRRLDKVRTEFVANASHELKTPLTAIRGYGETLLEPGVPSDDQRRFAERIVEHADRMGSLVEDLLTLARLEEPEQAIARERVLLREVVARVEGALSARAAAAGLTIQIDIESDDLAALGDPEGVRQILENLVDNAIRHSNASEVGIKAASLNEGKISVTVWDSGEGIPSAHLDRIFERFYRVDPSRSRATGGTGLGLSIVKHWSEQMGGRVSVDSALGNGTQIQVELPAAD